MLIVKATCTNCGAPLSLSDGQRHVICAYCDLSMLVEQPGAPGTAPAPGFMPRLTTERISPEDIRRVKQLILEGKRPEAVTHYANAAGIPHAEAEAAVTQLFVPELFRLFRQMPINAVGCSVALLLIAASAVGALYAALLVPESLGYIALALLCTFLCFVFIRWLVPKVVSSLTHMFGTRGRARVVKVAVMQTPGNAQAVVALVMFEVQPDAGGQPFFDEEALLLRKESLPKLEPGNVIAVRYDEPERKRVFPVTPIQVLNNPGVAEVRRVL